MVAVSKKKQDLLTLDYLKEILHYDPDSGDFINKTTRSNNCKKFGIAGSFHKTTGYVRIQINGKCYRAHRLAVFYVTGEWPEEQTDHINHERADNRWSNLRCVTHQENLMNQKMSRNNTSGITGVHFDKRDNIWKARITIDGKLIPLYYGKDKHLAILARKQAEIEYGFHENHGE